MYKSIVIVEDKDGNEHRGSVQSHTVLNLDQLVTVKLYNGKYLSGFVVEIIGEKRESLW